MVIVYKNDPVVTDSAKLSWAAKKSKQKQTAYRGAIHRQSETTSTLTGQKLVTLLMVAAPLGHAKSFFVRQLKPPPTQRLDKAKILGGGTDPKMTQKCLILG